MPAMPEAHQRFPFINLAKAIERAKQIYEGDQRGNEMPVPTAFAVFGYSEKSSGGFQTISALKSYGLLEDFGANESRKVKLSKAGLDYFRDEREDHRATKLKAFALSPLLFKALYDHWGAQVPSDAVARSHLKIERGLNEQSARTVLGIYKDNLVYADLKGGDKVIEVPPDGDDAEDLAPVKVGDYVQWTSGGVDQFKVPKKVWKIMGRHLFVLGSATGIDMSEATVVEPPKTDLAALTGKSFVADPSESDEIDDNHDISVLLSGNHLQINAFVDAEGLKTLKEMLGKYEEILKLMSKPKT